MRWNELESTLKQALSRPLPGHQAQERLSPRPRIGWEPGKVPDDARDSAAVLLLFPDSDDEATLVLTVREAGLSKHAGQVSLPGGSTDPGESLVDAAVREAHEEVGVDPRHIRVLGELSPLYIPVSGFALHPFVALCDERPDLIPDPVEVARILEVPLSDLTDSGKLHVAEREWRERSYSVPYIGIDGERIWGATAMILAEFLALFDHHPDPWNENG